MPSECTFALNCEHELHYAGRDYVEGVVTLKTTTDKNVKQIKVRFKGVTKCGFERMVQLKEGEPSIPLDNIYYTSKEKLVKIENVVHEAGVLPAGTYSWPFRFFVPEECPTSMEGQSGHIRYQLSLKIYNETKYKNVFIKPVTVIKTDDLNLRRECILPLETNNNSTYCCGLFDSASHLNLRTNFGGYAPGQWLRYTLEVFYKNEQKIIEYEIKFLRITIYKADHPSGCKATEETVLYHETKIDNEQAFQMVINAFFIPSTPPTTKTKYISIQYVLRVTLKTKCCSNKFKASLAVAVGTVPLKESLLPRAQRLLVQSSARQYIIRPSGFERPEPYDSTFIDRTTEEQHRVDDFMPIYPTYRNIFS